MPLQPGTRLGAYEVLSPIGAGGMGEVYRARDIRLDRSVAVKVLAPELASDPEFRARFTREAKAISALNHPHIGALFDIGREQETDYLVLELLQGETLAARLERGPLPLAQALRIGIEIADALEAAHRQGIIHRDLKPGNIILTAAGSKLLDFGLAKHTSASPVLAASTVATAPGTDTAPATIIGTLQYMAPEQVQGAPADARTDVFSLGTILYEMVTGAPAFSASTQASLIAAILTAEVPAVSTLVPVTPPVFDHIVQGCLAKDAADRWQTVHDVKLQLQWTQAHDIRMRADAAKSRPTRWPWAISALSIAIAVGALALRPETEVPPAPVRFEVLPPDTMQVDDADRATISPDGRQFVFTATVDGVRQLIRRDLSSTALQVVPGTRDAFCPFWSADSQSVAFFDVREDTLKRVRVDGGAARTLTKADVNLDAGGTWAGDTIVFGSGRGPLFQISSSGGTATPLVMPPGTGQKALTFPKFLPDGRHLTFSVVGEQAVYVGSLDGSPARKILDDASSAMFGAGRLVYGRGGRLYARRFDPGRTTFSGEEVVLATQAAGAVSISRDGTLVLPPDENPPTRPTWFDRNGRRLSTISTPARYESVVISPRNRHATLVRRDDDTNTNLWDVDLATGMVAQLTTDPAEDSDPSWSRNERALAFTSTRNGRRAVFIKDMDTGKEVPLARFDEPAVVDQWTPDDRFVIVRTQGKAVYAVPAGQNSLPRLLVDTPYTEDEVHVSPDGRWVAFNSNETGPWEVYVAAFPSFRSKRQISSGGGVQPQWRGDGRELFYLGANRTMMSVQVATGDGFTAAAPVRLFSVDISFHPFLAQFAVTSDGQRFLGLEPVEQGRGFTFVLHGLSDKSTAPID